MQSVVLGGCVYDAGCRLGTFTALGANVAVRRARFRPPRPLRPGTSERLRRAYARPGDRRWSEKVRFSGADVRQVLPHERAISRLAGGRSIVRLLPGFGEWHLRLETMREIVAPEAVEALPGFAKACCKSNACSHPIKSTRVWRVEVSTAGLSLVWSAEPTGS